WSWDLETDAIGALTHSSHAGIPVSQFIEPELIHYPTFDQRMIPAWFYRPQSPGPWPVVVFVHGGPESQTKAMFFPILQYFASCGYAVLAPNVRGSSGYGKTYLGLDDVEKRMDSVADLAHAAYWLRDRPDVDAQRLVVYGGSYGGFMVLSALTRHPELWAAGVDLVGISNFVTFLENTGPYRRHSRESEYGSLERDRDFLISISPINYVDHIQAPLIVIHGANDPRVPLSEAEQIVAALRARQIPVEFLVYPDEGHGLVKLANKLDAYPKIVAFLDQHIPKHES
ncbi:MAG: S9 family peptidase, partial [Chloroflexales bacterium]|nr:S9 family peptidase [Chloroflexales bacterium]